MALGVTEELPVPPEPDIVPEPMIGPDSMLSEVTGLMGDPVGGPADDFADRALTMWVVLVGAINFDLFGHLHNVVTDHDRYFDTAMALAAEWIGLEVALEDRPQRPAPAR